MLLEFTVENYRSFCGPYTLSMMATRLKGLSPEVDAANVLALPDGRKVLRVSALYGPNAGGKSNLVKAMKTMRTLVVDSARGQAADPIPVEPFRLSTETAGKPTSMEAVFLAEGVQYRYGFEVTRDRVVREWLYHRPTARESLLFERNGQEIRHSGVYSEGKAVLDLLRAISPTSPLRANALFVSLAAQVNGPIASRVLGWFNAPAILGSQFGMEGLRWIRGLTAQLLHNKSIPGVPLVEAILHQADLGIEGFEVEPEKAVDFEDGLLTPEQVAVFSQVGLDQTWRVTTTHGIRGPTGKTESLAHFNIDEDESTGTQKLFALAGIAAVSLGAGRLLVVDELDARMHPLLTRAIIGLFQDPSINTRGAQLIFATHDASLLEPEIFRRDQIWFVEKDTSEASTLRSLAEYRGLRADTSYRAPYLEGRLGAIPILRRFGKV